MSSRPDCVCGEVFGLGHGDCVSPQTSKRKLRQRNEDDIETVVIDRDSMPVGFNEPASSKRTALQGDGARRRVRERKTSLVDLQILIDEIDANELRACVEHNYRPSRSVRAFLDGLIKHKEGR